MGVHIRFKEFLYTKRNLARLENRLSDWCWVGGKCACWRPIKSYRTVTRGRKKGQIEVTLFEPPGKIRIVPVNHIRLANRGVI